jgi:iron-sulfur cluster assembly protein
MTITDAAQDKWIDLLKGLNLNPINIGLRLAIKGGGCSGFKKEVDYCELTNVSDDDMIEEHGKVTTVVDMKSMLFLGDAIIDYKDGLMGAGFVFDIPSAKNSCGCGESFSV